MTFKILSFRASNFRSLRDIELEFSTHADKPLTVIRAENGSGKTTILEAMKWCLFGDRALPRKRAEYPMIPSDWNELEGIDQKAIVSTEMMFEISSKFNHREDESIKYKIRRECSERYGESENADVINSEDVYLYKCTKLGQIQQDDAEQQIEYVILRNNLKDVFFTDGDAVNAKISNSSPSERAEFVKNTVKKDTARPFKVPKGIRMLVVNSNTGKRASYNDDSIIIEAFKDKDLVNNKIQYGNVEYISKENIYKFY